MKIEECFEIEEIPEFKKDIKKLSKKRFRSLPEDLKTFIKTQIFLYHKLGIDNEGVFHISGLGVESTKIYKGKKFACRSLKGKGCDSGIRVIYEYIEREQEKDKVILIEMYYKGDQEREKRDRIIRYLKSKEVV